MLSGVARHLLDHLFKVLMTICFCYIGIYIFGVGETAFQLSKQAGTHTKNKK